MATIHFILQGKGGVGKSMIASFLYQTLQELGCDVFAFDTDPVNKTLSNYKEFNVNYVDLLNSDGNINTRNFDELLETLAGAGEKQHIVVDNGASSFIALASYMRENDMLEVLQELGHKVFFHTVITGGQALFDTVDSFRKLGKIFPNSSIIVWLNPFFGAIQTEGKQFTDFKAYREVENTIHALINLPTGNKDLIGKDLEELLANRQSFQEGIKNSKHLAVRSRLNKYWKQLLASVLEANLVD